MIASAYPPRIDVAQLPTRVSLLERTTRAWGGPRIWVKRDDDTGGPLSGNKIRKLQFALAEALDRGADTVITCGGPQSNHCRATAVLARRLGLDVQLCLRGDGGDAVQGNLLLMRLLDARIHWWTPEQYDQRDANMAALAQALRARGRAPYTIAEGCSSPIGTWGYIEAASEIAEVEQELGVRFDAIVHAVGSGGTTAGLVLGCQRHGLKARIVGLAVGGHPDEFAGRIARLVEQTQARFGLNPDGPAPDVDILDQVGDGYGRSRAEERDALREAAAREGLLLDPVYSGKAWYGLGVQVRSGMLASCKDVLFLHTGGLFGLFPQADDFGLQAPSDGSVEGDVPPH